MLLYPAERIRSVTYAALLRIFQIWFSTFPHQEKCFLNRITRKVSKDSTVSIDKVSYDVPMQFILKNVMGRLKIAEQKLQRHQSTNLQVLTVGCQSEANLDLLCKILKSCREQIPELYPFLKVIPHRSILNLFYQEELDLLFGFQDDIPIKNDTLYKELFRIPLCCIIPAAHPYAARSGLAKEELYLENIVVCNSYAIPAKVAEMQNQISQHILPESTYVCENLQVLLTLVRAGYGCSVLPQKKSSQNPLLKKFISIVTNTSYY